VYKAKQQTFCHFWEEMPVILPFYSKLQYKQIVVCPKGFTKESMFWVMVTSKFRPFRAAQRTSTHNWLPSAVHHCEKASQKRTKIR
jgi:hypothetical protein